RVNESALSPLLLPVVIGVVVINPVLVGALVTEPAPLPAGKVNVTGPLPVLMVTVLGLFDPACACPLLLPGPLLLLSPNVSRLLLLLPAFFGPLLASAGGVFTT